MVSCGLKEGRVPGRKGGGSSQTGASPCRAQGGEEEGEGGSLSGCTRDRQRWASRLQRPAGPEGEGLCVPLKSVA